MSLRLLITGANGQVGWHLQRTLAPLGEVTAFTREQLDLGDPEAVSRACTRFGGRHRGERRGLHCGR